MTLRTTSYYLTFLLLLVSGILKAQQLPLYNQLYVNPFVFNPSLAGYPEKTNAYLIRNQKYLGFDGGNVTNILTVNGRVFSDKLGLGMTVFNDQMGITTAQGAGLSFSYRLKLKEEAFLGFGISAGITDRRFDLNAVVVQDVDDPTLDLSSFPARKAYPDATAGLYLQWKKFQFGFSVPQLIGNDLKFTNDGNHILERHYMAHATYDWIVSVPLNLSIIPFARVAYIPGAPLHYEGTVIADMKNIGWISASYKSNYAAAASCGIRIKQNLILGYSYSFIINTTKSYGATNQEILLGYTFGVKGNDKEKKALEEALAENERLKQELMKKQQANDSIAKNNQELQEKLREQEQYYNDTIAKLNEELRKLRENAGKTKDTISEIKANNPNDNDPRIRNSKDDHFTELDKTTDSPKGYYVIDGAFSKLENAETHFNEIKGSFPEARIIFNHRNGLYYILLTYSDDKNKVFQTHNKAKAMGEEKAWILNYR